MALVQVNSSLTCFYEVLYEQWDGFRPDSLTIHEIKFLAFLLQNPSIYVSCLVLLCSSSQSSKQGFETTVRISLSLASCWARLTLG